MMMTLSQKTCLYNCVSVFFGFKNDMCIRGRLYLCVFFAEHDWLKKRSVLLFIMEMIL